jgi:ComF family protein
LSNFFARRFDSVSRFGAGSRSIGAFWRSAVKGLQRALPQACMLCAASSGDALLCEACAAALPRIRCACPLCGLPSAVAVVCGACLARPLPFSATIAAWVYGFPVDQLLHAFKYGTALALAEVFADALCAAVRQSTDARADAIVALPLSPARQRVRGFNQAHEIARRVAASLELPLIRGLARVRDSPPQATLAWRSRAGNVRDAFVGAPSLRDCRIAIIDDVMTTGVTLSAAAKAARRAGALGVEAWVVTRTLPPEDSNASESHDSCSGRPEGVG